MEAIDFEQAASELATEWWLRHVVQDKLGFVDRIIGINRQSFGNPDQDDLREPNPFQEVRKMGLPFGEGEDPDSSFHSE